MGFWNGAWNGSNLNKPLPEDCLHAIGTLARLESLRLEGLRGQNECLAFLAGLTGLKTLSFIGVALSAQPMLSYLPPLARLEALGFSLSDINDDDLRRLAVLPRLESLRLGDGRRQFGPCFTPAGLASLASIESLDEVELEYIFESPREIDALRGIKRLQKLHLNTSSGGSDDPGVTLDDGTSVYSKDEDELEGFRRTFSALRKSKPGIVIDGRGITTFERQPALRWPDLDLDAFMERPSAWLPGGDIVWMTPKELADFKQAGGRASFYGATWLDEEQGRLVTIEF